jgi:hypothetical protein
MPEPSPAWYQRQRLQLIQELLGTQLQEQQRGATPAATPYIQTALESVAAALRCYRTARRAPHSPATETQEEM